MRYLSFPKLIAAFCATWIIGCSPRGDVSKGGGVEPKSLTPATWAALSRRGDSHELLNSFVGDWDVTVTSWSAPNAVPDQSVAVSRAKLVLGARFVRERYRGLAGQESIEGIGYLGFDRGSNLFTSVWMDSLNTSVALSKGPYDPVTKTFALTGEIYDPLLGRTKVTRTDIRLISDDEYEVSMRDTSPEAIEFKSLEMVYRRRSPR